MSTGVPNTDLVDLINTTLTNLPDMEFEFALKYQQYEVVSKWFREEKIQIDSGTSITRNISLDTTGNAKHVRLYQRNAINISDTQKQITAPWVQANTYYSYERRELLRNRDPAAFVRLIDSRRLDGVLDLANLIELRAICAPNSDTDDLNPRGLFYWLSLRNGADEGEGFDGRTIRWNGGGTTTNKGGIDGNLAANARWRNYAATYNAVNGEFLSRLRRAFYACKFVAPPGLPTQKATVDPEKFKMYCGLDTLVAYDDLVAKNNDNLGADLGKFSGDSVFRRVGITYMPVLDDVACGISTYKPFVGVNHSKFFPIVQEGDWMRENEAMNDVEQHNVFTVHMDSSYQLFCNNVREAGFVMHTPVPAGL